MPFPGRATLPTDANRTEDTGSSETCLNHALKMGRLEECVEERLDWFGERIPASPQKRRKEAKQTEQFDQGRENKIEKRRSSGLLQSHFVVHHVVIRNLLNIRRRPPEK